LVPSRSWDSHLYLIYGFFRTSFSSLYCRMLPSKTFSSLWVPMTQDVLDSLTRVFSWLSLQTPRGNWPCDAQPRCQRKSRGFHKFSCAPFMSPTSHGYLDKRTVKCNFGIQLPGKSLQDKPVFQITRLDKHINPKPPPFFVFRQHRQIRIANRTGIRAWSIRIRCFPSSPRCCPSRITAVCHSHRQIHTEQIFLPQLTKKHV